MHLLDSTRKLQIAADIAGSLDYIVSAVNFAAPSTFTPVPAKGNFAGTVATDILTAPAAGEWRNVEQVQVSNVHATNVVAVTITDVGGTTVRLCKVINLGPGEWFTWNENGVVFVYDAEGKVKAGGTAASDTAAGVAAIAVQSDLETATDVSKIVTPGRAQFHPSAGKCWAKCIVTGGVPALTVSYNITSITDTALGQLTVTINVDFSSANWECGASVERASTALTVANLRAVAVRNAGQAAGTVLLECWDGTATTALAADPAAWHFDGKGDQ